ncbi:MAG: hypothetical protein AAF985_09960 [Bacteroidota bacterium]
MEKRLESAKSRNNQDIDGMKARISGGMRRGSGQVDNKRARNRYIFRSNLMLLGIIVILVTISYLLFVQYMPLFLDSLGLDPVPADQ